MSTEYRNQGAASPCTHLSYLTQDVKTKEGVKERPERVPDVTASQLVAGQMQHEAFVRNLYFGRGRGHGLP